MDKNIKLSIVVPSYNETAEIKKQAIEKIDEYMKNQSFSYEVLIVDDGSTNDTRGLVKDFIKNRKNFRFLENEHGGKAITVMSGMLESKGKIALFTDMDQATPISELQKILPEFEKGFDIVIGSRSGRKGAPLIRKLAALGFATLRNITLGLPFKDTQCGFKAFSRQATETVFPELLKRWKSMKAKGAAVNAGFDIETLYLAKKKNLRISEIPVIWHHVGTEQVQIISDSIQALKDMFRIRINDLQGKYS